MGDNNSKWEPVSIGDLKYGDKVRALHADGDVIHGTVSDLGYAFHTNAAYLGIRELLGKGWSFERAVPERTLPSEPGLYVTTTAATDHLECANVFRRFVHTWDEDIEAEVEQIASRLGLVRLVPVTEVEEAEKRIQAAREYVDRSAGTYIASEPAATILALLDGEARS